MVPLQAVVIRRDQQGDERSGIFTVSENRARFTPVETGLIGGLDIEVSGIDAGAEVIVGPYQVLRELEDGERVRKR